ncbi:MAG TPA: hypothetical protein PKD05_17415, partial [Candidatus Melainabacteria bacterium]|nr:hypothetical protein [Candidatus Melainabacteria bacterium]
MTVDKPSESEERPEKNQFKAGDNVKEYAIQEQAQNVEYNEACQAGQDFTSMASLKVPSVQERMSGYKTGATAESGKEWKCCLSHRKVGNRRSIMPLIDQEYLSQLQSAGLHVSHPIPAFCDGVWVCKPVTTPGNNLPGYTGGYITIGDADPGCPDIDAPMLGFYFHHDKWIVDGQDCA